MLTRLRWHVLAPRLQRRFRGTTNRQIAAAALTVGLGTGLVSAVSVLRELYVAASFGTGDALDAFIVALVLPSFVINVVGGSVAAALIPTYIRVHDQEGQSEAQAVVSSIVLLGAGLLGIAAILLALASPVILPLLASGFDPEKLELTRRLFLLLLPAVILGGVASIWSAVLNAGNQFAWVAFSQVLIPIATIAALIAGRSWEVYALAVGMVGGFGLRLVTLGWALSRHGVDIWPRWQGVSGAVRQVVAQYLPMVAGAGLLSGTTLVDQAVASTLEPGSVATLSYGTRIVLLVTGLGAAALGTAVLPFFSRMVAASDWDHLRRTMRTFAVLTLLITLPCAAVLYHFSAPIVSLVFERGAFTAEDTALVSRVQALYALQLPFFGVGILYSRLISSLGANRLLLVQAGICLAVDAALAFGLSRLLGVAGIALGTSVMYAVALGLLALMGRRALAAVSLGKASSQKPVSGPAATT